MVAKELCSCHFVAGLSIDECKARSNVPPGLFKILNVKTVSDYEIIVEPSILDYLTIIAVSPTVSAYFDPKNPEKGCRLN